LADLQGFDCIHEMDHSLGHTIPFNPVGQLNHASRTGSDNNIRPRPLYRLDLVLTDLPRESVVVEVERSAKTAAAVVVHFYEPVSENLPQNLARLFRDALVAC